jgi:alanine racemase
MTATSTVVPRARAVVDLGAISANVTRLAEAAPGAAVMAVVKADGYGHGLVPSARAAVAGGASWLGVALLEEALALREAGLEVPVLAWLLTPGDVDAFTRAIAADVDLSASDTAMLGDLVTAARAAGRPVRVHLKADTGLGRGGATPQEWGALVAAAATAQAAGDLVVVGLWSHLAYADVPRHPTVAAQLASFQACLEVAAQAGVQPEVRHLANSAATLALPETHFDLVRPGIAVYGISPGPEVGTARDLGLRPAMRLEARLAQVKRVPAGHGVSYGHEYVTSADTVLALVPLGYADGIPRAASGRGPVLVGSGVRPVAGRVCMDQFVLDVGGDGIAGEVAVGDTVVLFGTGEHGEPTVEDWALAAETIPYEIVTRIGPRVVRTYVGR